MITNYPNRRMKNCETGVFHNMLSWRGIDIPEELIFGIGSGLYFMYSPLLSVSGIKYPLLRLQPVEIVKRVAERLHVKIHVKSFGKDKKRATVFLNELLKKGIPTGVVLNVKGLSYFNVSGTESDFNGHIVTVLDMDGNDYIVADTDYRLSSDDYVRVPMDIMEEIRFSPGIATPHGKLFWMDSRPAPVLDEEKIRSAIISGIKETCNKFLRVPLPHYGINGLHYFAEDIRSWETKYTPRQISYIIMWYYRLIERAGTGGSGYRYIYRDFLNEAARLFNSDDFKEMTKTMELAADHWRLFCVEGRRFIRNQENSTLQTMADIINKIADYEFSTFQQAQKWIVKYAKRYL